MFVCVCIGVVYFVVFVGFFFEALAQRFLGSAAKVVLICLVVMRGLKYINLKVVVDEVCDFSVEKGYKIEYCLCFMNERFDVEGFFIISRDEYWQ